MKVLTKECIGGLIKTRIENSQKGDYGHSFLVVGGKYKMGAAIIAARACLRTGSGLLTVSVPQEERMVLQIAIPEAMLAIRENYADNLNAFTAVSLGCGIGTGKESTQMLTHFIAENTSPLVIDADGLNIISNFKNLLQSLPQNTILTPHTKEFDRLFGNHKSSQDRIKTAIEKAQEYKIVIVLKGHITLITSRGEFFFNSTGNSGLAKGGSGDALTGIITSLLSQGYLPLDASKIGVFLHGFAADLALKKQSVESMLITDVLENLGLAFKQISAHKCNELTYHPLIDKNWSI